MERFWQLERSLWNSMACNNPVQNNTKEILGNVHCREVVPVAEVKFFSFEYTWTWKSWTLEKSENLVGSSCDLNKPQIVNELQNFSLIGANKTSASNSLSKKVVTSSSDWNGFFDDVLTPEENLVRIEVRKIMEEQIRLRIIDHIENATFPQDWFDIIKNTGVSKYFYSGKYGKDRKNSSAFLKNAILFEIGRIDVSIATSLMIQHRILGRTIELYGSQEQIDEFLPKIRDMELIGGWALTEQNVGSDASAIETTVIEDSNRDFILNGNKRWIGNANKDIICVFANNISAKEVQAFILDLTLPGVTREVIQNKLSVRPIHNMQLYFENVKIARNRRIPGIKSFDSVAQLLAESRIWVSWLATGVSAGVYDYMIKYLSTRTQFNNTALTAYQLIQQKLVSTMAIVQISLALVRQVTHLQASGKATIGMIAMTKAFVTSKAREAARLGRESLGGNGILIENHVMKALMDIEASYTYEGTYDINTLIAGRELTGISAFKTR